MLQLQQPEYIDFEMKWLAQPKEDPAAPTSDDQKELGLVGSQEKSRQTIAKLEKKN